VLFIYFSGEKKGTKGNKVKKGIKATATTGREIHYRSAGRITQGK
jgi:hypothetical protein